ncbi:MAG: PrsW family glutamic-type intramembrane protease [Saprospiraceae bacterium]|nr:PrsW family glutamic-type intramembrane protease [Saprospiraceae bacterium]
MISVFLVGLSILPAFVICIYIWWRDRHEQEPALMLFVAFIMGSLSTYPALKLEEFGVENFYIATSSSVMNSFVFAFGIIAVSEELIKFLFLRYFIFPRKAYNQPLDGIVYAVVLGMGFAAVENIIYVVYRSDGFEDALQTAFTRMITAVPAHASFAVVMGFFMGKAKFITKPVSKSLHLLTGLALAICIHGAYDFFLFQKMTGALSFLTSLILVGSLALSYNLINRLDDSSSNLNP